MTVRLVVCVALACVVYAENVLAQPVTLRGSSEHVAWAYEAAHEHDFTFLPTPGEVRRFVRLGLLVPLRGNAHYRVLERVSFPYARPETRLLVERLSAQYHNACGERLVVTSATRPQNRQPQNASSLSVHPTGMAVDLRVPSTARCREWLERNLLTMEARRVVIATREHRPPHYHVVVLPRQYAAYVALRTGSAVEHQVRSGETLSHIALRYGTTVQRVMEENGLRSTMIRAGQTLRISR